MTATVHLGFSFYDGEGGWAAQDRWEQRLTLHSAQFIPSLGGFMVLGVI